MSEKPPMTMDEERLIKEEVSETMASLIILRLEHGQRIAQENVPRQPQGLEKRQVLEVLVELLEGPGHLLVSEDQPPKIVFSYEEVRLKLEQTAAPRPLGQAFREFTTYDPIVTPLPLSGGAPAANLVKL